MAYSYQTERPYLFTDEGQKDFLKVRDQAYKLIQLAGAFTVGKLLDNSRGITGDSWKQLACVDRLVELMEFKYVSDHSHVATQNRVLVKL